MSVDTSASAAVVSELSGAHVEDNRLSAIAGLKVFCTLAIFCWHVGWSLGFPYASRCVDFFFIASGFLMAYNHFGMYKHTCSECFSLLWRKIKQIYPSYLFGFGLAVVYLMLTDDPQLALNPGAAINMTVNLAMLQAWFEPIAFSFNGASWFISALMLCYFSRLS